jgi:glycosyltransferase involved in cell wall biosynthesis
LRLKISEQAKLLHLSNRYSGSLYRVMAAGKGHNVFDYLLASKESQLEAENVLSAHLKRIGAYLEPGQHYREIPDLADDPELIASVIIPVNNRPKFIGTAIESVLAQTIQKVEVLIVVNGGQDDPTIPAVQAYMPGGKKFNAEKPEVRLLILDINNIGMCLNLGAKAARGKYYVQLDSDDRLKPDAVEKILQIYETDTRIGMVIGSYEVWELDDTSGKLGRVDSIPVVTHDEWTEENGRNNLLRINGAGAPRSIPINVIQEIGYFGINDEPFARNYGEDYEMVLKVSEKYRIGRVWDPIYDVVRHSGGTDHSIDQGTIDRNDEAKDYMRQQAIQRRIKLNR